MNTKTKCIAVASVAALTLAMSTLDTPNVKALDIRSQNVTTIGPQSTQFGRCLYDQAQWFPSTRTYRISGIGCQPGGHLRVYIDSYRNDNDPRLYRDYSNRVTSGTVSRTLSNPSAIFYRGGPDAG